MEDQQRNPLLSILTTPTLQYQTKPHLQTTMTGPTMVLTGPTLVLTGPTMVPIIQTMVLPTTLLLRNRQVYLRF